MHQIRAGSSSEGRPIFVVDAASKGAVDIAALTQELVTAASKSPPTALAGPGERSGARQQRNAIGRTGRHSRGANGNVGAGAKDKSAVA